MVTVEDVAVRLGDVDALDGVSVDVDRGRLVGLIGPNGAGKTTLLRTITAAITPDRGAVHIDGVDVAGLSSRAVSRKVAVVPQDTALGFDFDVHELVAMGRTPYIGRLSRGQRADRDAVARAMDRTDVAQFANRAVSEVSGGERQRVLLARAIAQDTPVLLLDEPTASLDINHQVRTFELVEALVADGKTVIAAIHDLNLAARYCDELLLLADGRVMARGPSETVLTTEHVRRAFQTASLVTSHPVTGSMHVTALPGPPPGHARGHVHLVPGGDRRDLVFALWAAGYEVTVGPLPRGAATVRMARQLDIDVVTADPFAKIDRETREAVDGAIRTADATILGAVELTPGIRSILEAAESAETLFVLEDRPPGTREGATGRERYDALRERGTVHTADELLAALSSRLGPETSESIPSEQAEDVHGH